MSYTSGFAIHTFGVATELPRSAAGIPGHVAYAIGGSKAGREQYRMPHWNDGYNGLYKVAGTTKLNGVAFPARVYLFPQDAPGLCLAWTYTDAGGAFLFSNLRGGTYLVLGLDPTGNWDGVVHTLITAVAM